MMREALAVKIRGRIEADGVALIPAGDVWAALATGDDGPLSVDDALTAFAESNGWVVEAKEPRLNPAFIFREREEGTEVAGGDDSINTGDTVRVVDGPLRGTSASSSG